MQKEVRQVVMEESLQQYLLDLILATRDHEKIEYGASPRSGLQIYRFSQARAYLARRPFCAPDDIQFAFLHCTPHRLVLNETAPGAGNTAKDVVQQILEHVPVPV